VGVGISGVEGLQAACASDYSIAQVETNVVMYFLLMLDIVHVCFLLLRQFSRHLFIHFLITGSLSYASLS